jgi:hypothetical protein
MFDGVGEPQCWRLAGRDGKACATAACRANLEPILLPLRRMRCDELIRVAASRLFCERSAATAKA